MNASVADNFPIETRASKYIARSFFTYESDIPAGLLPFVPGTSVLLTFNIQGDSDFFWTAFSATAVQAGVSVNFPAINATITNATTGRSFSNSPVPLNNMAGSGQPPTRRISIIPSQPLLLPMITLWEKKTTINVQLDNVITALTYTSVQLNFHGIKAFTS